MDNFFTHIHTHAYTSVETGGCRRIVIRRDWELWWNRGTIDRWKWKIGEHGATVFSHWTVTFRCSRRKNEDLSTDVAISIANPASLLLPPSFSLGSTPPSAQTILGPSPERKGWFVADCSTVTHILTRTFWHDAFRSRHGRPLFLPSTYFYLPIRDKRIRCNPIPWIKLAPNSNNKVHSLLPFFFFFLFAKLGKFG